MPVRTVRYEGFPSALVQALPYYRRVPKDPRKQKAFRQNVRNRCRTNPQYREWVLKACARDPLFFVNVFCYVVEPRKSEVRMFNTWPHQDVVIAEMVDGWGKRDYVGKKSREQGASWIMAALFAWAFVFLKNQELRFGSKDDETMDEVGNMDSFGAKIDFTLERLPEWMRPEYKRSSGKHTWKWSKGGKVLKSGNAIKGYSATAGIARGGRCTVFFKDESAFFPSGSDYEADANLIYVTDCQIDWSTPNGQGNAFHDKVHGDGEETLLVLDFLDNPIHGANKYTTTAGMLEILDGERLPDYEYVLDGLIRSPWGDKKWRRHGRDNLWLSRELYMNFGGSKSRPFPASIIDRCRLQCGAPLHTGMLLYDHVDPANTKAIQWQDNPTFKFDLWRPVDEWGHIHVQKPVMGADISLGNSGDMSSNSVLSIWDAASWEQVGELAVNNISPGDFARLAVAVCWWLSPSGATFFNWEKNGSAGTTFTDEMMQLGYPNVYVENTSSDQQRWMVQKSDRPGYHNRKPAAAFAPMLAAMERNQATFRSRALVAECSEYEVDDKGKWVHPKSVNTRDSAAKGEGHGDRAIAAAMAFLAMRERHPAPKPGEEKRKPKTGFLARVAAEKERVRRARRRLSRW